MSRLILAVLLTCLALPAMAQPVRFCASMADQAGSLARWRDGGMPMAEAQAIMRNIVRDPGPGRDMFERMIRAIWTEGLPWDRAETIAFRTCGWPR